MRRPKRGSVKFHIGEVELTQVGTKRFDLGDPYHLAITMSWGAFFASCLAIDIVVNFVFALLYMLQPHAVANVAPGSLSDAFFFSVETLATVGYGVMAPASTYGHIVASCELTCGLAFTALVTGLIFVRFSRIKAKVAFADKVVIARHDGHPTLMIRVAYDRAGSLADAEARVTFMRFMRTTEGRSFRHSEELVLTRSRLALLVLTWTIMHEIDTASPLSGLTTEKLVETDARLIVTIKARNMAAGAEVFDMAVYTAEQILFGMNYQDVVTSGDATHINADLRKLNLVEPDIEPDDVEPLHGPRSTRMVPLRVNGTTVGDGGPSTPVWIAGVAMIYGSPMVSITSGAGSTDGNTLVKRRTINREHHCSSHTLVHSERCHCSVRDGKSH